MKAKYGFIFCASLLMLVMGTACEDEWDSHYKEQIEGGNSQIEVTELSVIDFLESETEYSQMTNLLYGQGVLDMMQERGLSGLKYTVFVVNNDNIRPFEEDSSYIAFSHVLTGKVSPSQLSGGQRLLTWTDRYVDVEKSRLATAEDSIAVGGSVVKRVVETPDAYIYELDKLIAIPRSLLEILERLPDEEYSLFKGMVYKHAEETFDREASKVIGIDPSGNTVYDSVKVLRFPYFEENGIDITSSAARMTMLIPSNELIEDAIENAHARIAEWNEFEEQMAIQYGYDANNSITGYSRDSAIIEDWCFQCAFFNEELLPEDFYDAEVIDYYTAFDKQWRTTVNKVDTENMVPMSNGKAYYMTSLRVPQNVLIYRIKDYAKHYQYLNEADKAACYVLDNMTFNRVSTEVADWTPGEGWPMHNNTAVWFDAADVTIQNIRLDFKPYHFKLNANNSYAMQPYMIPPGEYTMHVGFGNIGGMKGPLKISLIDEEDPDNPDKTIVAGTILSANMQGYSRDRYGTGYPEGYDSRLSDKYDKDGTLLGTVTITEMRRLVIRYQVVDWGDSGNRINPHHFTFRPTANCY